MKIPIPCFRIFIIYGFILTVSSAKMVRAQLHKEIAQPYTLSTDCPIPPNPNPGPICRYGTFYTESEDIFISTLKIPHEKIKKFLYGVLEREIDLQDIRRWLLEFDNLGKAIRIINLEGFQLKNKEYKGKYIVAGLCFIPKWKVKYARDTSDSNTFQTEGFRIAVAFWRKNPTLKDLDSPNQFVIAGIGQIDNALDPVQEAFEKSVEMSTLEIKFDNYNIAPNSELKKDSIYQGAEKDSLLKSTREFDFVFLDLMRYWDLATSDRFYQPNPNGNSRREEYAIYIERSLVQYDGLIDSLSGVTGDSSIFLNQNWRSLSFRPYPLPKLESKITQAAIAFEDGLRCPPWWKDYNTINNPQTGFHSLMAANSFYPEIEASNPSPDTTDRKLGISVHFGLSTEINNIDELLNNYDLFELDVEYALRNRFSVEALLGRYKFDPLLDSLSIGLNVLGKLYFSPRLLGSAGLPQNATFFISGGVGGYEILDEFKFGVIGNVGFRFPIIVLNRRVYPEVAVQYQNPTLLSSRNLNLNLVAAKLGLKLYLR